MARTRSGDADPLVGSAAPWCCWRWRPPSGAWDWAAGGTAGALLARELTGSAAAAGPRAKVAGLVVDVPRGVAPRRAAGNVVEYALPTGHASPWSTCIMGPGVPVSAGPGWAWSNLDRTQPVLPLRPGLAERRTHDYIRHGTTALFAALEVATSKVTDRCCARHRHTEFLAFCKQVVNAYPRRELHIVLDNYGTHKHPRVVTWLARNPRIRLHFTPTSASWMNLVEAFYGIVTRQAIRVFIDAWNERCQPFPWTKTAQQILAKARRS